MARIDSVGLPAPSLPASEPARRNAPPSSTIGYLIPEFPGQTHVLIWREITHLREWGVPVRIFSTRNPSERDRARHAFASGAAAETTYLWPMGWARGFSTLLWAAARPAALARCATLALTLPVDKGPRWRRVLPLLLPACRLAREATRLGVSRLHCHSCANGAVLCMMAQRLAGLPFSLTLHSNVEWWGGAMREKFEDADFTIIVSQWVLNQVRRDFPSLAPGKVLLGSPGVDTRKWRPPPCPAGPPAGSLRLITVGRLHASKGHDVLLAAVKLVALGGTDVSLRVVGAGPERGALERLARETGLADRISFLGSLGEERIIDEMTRSDVFVLATHAEALGVVYMEAMAMEIATIGTATGGVGEIITDGEDGLLVPPNDPATLAAAVRRLADDPALRSRLAKAGRRTVVERFDSRHGAATLYKQIFGFAPDGYDGTGTGD